VNTTRRVCTVLVLLLPLLAGRSPAAEAEQETRRRLDFTTAQMEREIENSGLLYAEPALDAYLQSVLDRLFPDKAGQLQVRVLRETDFNAFALANGHIYFNTGTLLRLDDEAGLASILGHEGTHVTEDHVFRFLQTVKRGSVVTNAVDIVGWSVGLPVVGALLGVSTMMGFSREHERDADRGGFRRMLDAGYDPRAGGETFARLARELRARKIRQAPFFFASHPAVMDRVASFEKLSREAAVQGDRHRGEYAARTLAVRLDVLASIHQAGDTKLLLFLLDQERMVDSLPPESRYYLAEALRIRNADGDAARALGEYERALGEAPDFAPTHFALGALYLRAGQRAGARARFERYLALAPDGNQAAYARQYLNQLARESPP